LFFAGFQDGKIRILNILTNDITEIENKDIGPITQLEVAKGLLFARSSSKEKILIWDLEKKVEVCIQKNSGSLPFQIWENFLITKTTNQKVQICKAETGEMVHSLSLQEDEGEIASLKIHDGVLLTGTKQLNVSAGGGKIIGWNIKTGKQIWEVKISIVSASHIQVHKNFLVTSSITGSVSICSIATKNNIFNLKPNTHKGPVPLQCHEDFLITSNENLQAWEFSGSTLSVDIFCSRS
jgi:WD40 repeat protein